MAGMYGFVPAAGQFFQCCEVNCAQTPLYQSGISGRSFIRVVCSCELIFMIAAVSESGVRSSFWTSVHAAGFSYRPKLKFVCPVPVVMTGRWKMPFQYVYGL